MGDWIKCERKLPEPGVGGVGIVREDQRIQCLALHTRLEIVPFSTSKTGKPHSSWGIGQSTQMYLDSLVGNK